MTTATNGGFLTSLYVLIAPLVAWVLLKMRPHPILVIATPMALVGVYWLNGARFTDLNFGDALVLLSALAWAVQVALIGEISKRTGLPITISVISFLVTALAGLVGMALFEKPDLAIITAHWPQLGYTAVFSTAIAFTLQAVAQQYVPPANAAIVLSAEGLFAALGAALILGDRLAPLGYAGAALIFAAIVLVEVIPALRQHFRAAA
jgi:drug/metabolite transporter (DMT)-like permease